LPELGERKNREKVLTRKCFMTTWKEEKRNWMRHLNSPALFQSDGTPDTFPHPTLFYYFLF
jgi:hypothetical protein